MYGMIAYAVGAGLALAVAFGTGWHYGVKGPKADLAALEARVARDDARRAQELAERRAQDERANERIRAQQEAAARDLADATARAGAARDEAARLAAKLRVLPPGGCYLPADARIVFDRAAKPGGSATDRPAAAPDRAAAPTGVPASGPGGPVDMATSSQDAAPVDCVTVWEVGARNTAAATFNADALDACNGQLMSYWQACTGRKLDIAQ